MNEPEHNITLLEQSRHAPKSLFEPENFERLKIDSETGNGCYKLGVLSLDIKTTTHGSPK